MALHNDYSAQAKAVGDTEYPTLQQANRSTRVPPPPFSQADKSTPIEASHKAFSAANELSYRIVRLADALLGPIPCNGVEANPKPSGILYGLEASADDAIRTINEANEALSRLERTLGI